ncbi:hypothetical protein DEI81_08000 [Curtobacterium sp. MCBD17_013]|uniref:hypothetical protein n=1 Tax=Curtobacterium sp. MCBD17_013 TaxID=2175668 RepID=UPI000DA76622|nr:hypothetical protein [Curtobacterium sp. MCBD17_013]PZF63340.1 hypothetical protein DEI81_08000 [Curtobacterium sp. MCBD17_013]
MTAKNTARTAQDSPLGPVVTSLADATELERRDLLAVARWKIAREIDNGVPAHALARLVGELGRLDSEIRHLDDQSIIHGDVPDGIFDPSKL